MWRDRSHIVDIGRRGSSHGLLLSLSRHIPLVCLLLSLLELIRLRGLLSLRLRLRLRLCLRLCLSLRLSLNLAQVQMRFWLLHSSLLNGSRALCRCQVCIPKA